MKGLDRFYKYWLNLTLLITALSVISVGIVFYGRISNLRSETRRLYQTMIIASLRKEYSRIAEEIYLRLDTLDARRAVLQEILGDVGTVQLILDKKNGSTPSDRKDPVEVTSEGNLMKASMGIAFEDVFLGDLNVNVRFAEASWLDEIWHSKVLLVLFLFSAVWLMAMWLLKRSVFRPLAQALQEESEALAVGKIAQQVAHDIRSPLSALNILLNRATTIPNEHRKVARMAVQRISDIASDLQNRNRPNNLNCSDPGSEKLDRVNLTSAIENVLSEKRIELQGLDIELRMNKSPDSFGLFIDFDPAEFKRVISNLTNNSVEAIERQGSINVHLSRQNDAALIEIEDNGRGIPADVLKELGQRGLSVGKATGSGLGLFHAGQAVRNRGGELRIESKVAVGTKVTLKLPLSQPPPWLKQSLDISSRSHVVILDDDLGIHKVWDIRFAEFQREGNENFQIHYLSEASELFDLAAKLKHEVVTFLIDYEISATGPTGLDLIEELNIEARSILVSSRDEEQSIQDRCTKGNIKILPKSSIALIPIKRLET